MRRRRTPRFLRIQDVYDMHADLIELSGGLSGVRDPGLLDSALARPQATFGGSYLHPTLEEMCAAYIVGVAQNHPFLDGNKRTAWAAGRMFLAMNGYQLKPRTADAVQHVEMAAQGQITVQDLAVWIAKHMQSRR